MIVGTAGHIDHGKTALVRALTGMDTDRLPEEKRRGITIELGFAHMAVPGGGRIGFVDMPGHEKLVRTMAAGASGIDYALLLVAADDGIMPQTVEHLTILSLLGIARGAALITKTDLAGEELLRERERQVRALLDDAGLHGYRILRVCAPRAEGVDTLRVLLLDEARHGDNAGAAVHGAYGTPPRTASASGRPGVPAGFRMGLDRVFSLDGVGTVVAGSIAAGAVRIGDMLCLAHAPDQPCRVRSLHVHNREAAEAHAGQRCAVGLAGLPREAVERGQVLCHPAIARTSQRIDAWLKVAPTETKPLRSGATVHLHIGTQECLATVAVLGQPAIAPGEAGPAQLVLLVPMAAWQQDPFIVRDASATRTVGGGMVLDPEGPVRYRQTPERLAWLKALKTGSHRERLLAALVHAPFGMSTATWLRSAGLLDWPFPPESLLEQVTFGGGGKWLIARARLPESEAAVTAMLAAFHAKYPQDIGPDLQRARRLAAPRMPQEVWDLLVSHMLAQNAVIQRNGFMHLPEHGEQLLAAEAAVAERALPLMLAGRYDPPWVRDITAATGLGEDQVRQVLMRMSRGGDVYQIVKDLYYHPQAVRELAAIARGIEEHGGGIATTAFRDATGLGRKRAIQILEFFDRIGFLRRKGDVRHLSRGTTLFAAM